MTQAVSPLAELPGFSDALVKFNNPILGVLIGRKVGTVLKNKAFILGGIILIAIGIEILIKG